MNQSGESLTLKQAPSGKLPVISKALSQPNYEIKSLKLLNQGIRNFVLFLWMAIVDNCPWGGRGVSSNKQIVDH